MLTVPARAASWPEGQFDEPIPAWAGARTPVRYLVNRAAWH